MEAVIPLKNNFTSGGDIFQNIKNFFTGGGEERQEKSIPENMTPVDEEKVYLLDQ